MSTLTLTVRDQRQLAGCLQILLSPLEYDELDDWRRDVNRSLKRLLRADMAGFDLPAPGLERVFSEEHDVAAMRRYHDRLARLERRLRIFRRWQRLGVSNRSQAWGRYLPEMLRSSYYNDYIVPLRCFDTLAAHARYPRLDAAAGLYFHHERESGPRFGERGLGLLRLVYPAFESGSATWLELGRHGRELERMVDTLSQPAALYDRRARLLHRNPALAQVLAGADGSLLAEAADRLARELSGPTPAHGGAGGFGPAGGVDLAAGVPSASRRLTTACGRYELRATYLGAGPGDRRQILVTVTAAGSTLPAPAELRRRFGLTPRQAEVALLLARRRTNAELAAELSISPHTARRHTEKVLLKLGLSSRRDVRKAVSASPGGEFEAASPSVHGATS